MAALVPLFFAVAVTWSLCIPRWLNSDEPFHYYYVKYLLEERRLPTREETYEAAHPPLYYLAGAAWALPFRGKGADFLDNWIRVMSALLGTFTIFLLYRIGRDCLGSAWAGAGMAALAAVNPMFTAASAVVSNDAGALFASTAAMYIILAATRRGVGWATAAVCGAAAGTACLFKINANFLAVFFCAYYVSLPEARRRGALRAAAELALFAAVFAAVCGWWYVRGWFIIGDKAFFNTMVEIEPNPLYAPANFAWFMKTIMLNFWLPNDYLRGHPAGLPTAVKVFYFGLSAGMIVLIVVCAARTLWRRPPERRRILLGFVLCTLIFLSQQHAINMQFPTAQARYMFPMYAAFAALAVMPLKAAAGRWFGSGVIAAAAAGLCMNLVWALVWLLPVRGPQFDIL